MFDQIDASVFRPDRNAAYFFRGSHYMKYVPGKGVEHQQVHDREARAGDREQPQPVGDLVVLVAANEDQGNVGAAMRVEIQVVDSIPREASGKYRTVVSKVGPSPASEAVEPRGGGTSDAE